MIQKMEEEDKIRTNRSGWRKYVASIKKKYSYTTLLFSTATAVQVDQVHQSRQYGSTVELYQPIILMLSVDSLKFFFVPRRKNQCEEGMTTSINHTYTPSCPTQMPVRGDKLTKFSRQYIPRHQNYGQTKRIKP
jgi:hypothetical protein